MDRAAPPTVLWHHLPTLPGGGGAILELRGHAPCAPAPTADGWHVLATDRPLPTVLRVPHLAAPLFAPLLVDLAIAQQRHPTMPVLLIRPADHLARRLIASSRVRAIITTASALAPVAVPTAQPQVWVGVPRPTADEPGLRDQRDVALLAALEQAQTMRQAAHWVGLSRRTALRRLCVLPLHRHGGLRKRSPPQWAAAIRAWLAAPDGKAKT